MVESSKRANCKYNQIYCCIIITFLMHVFRHPYHKALPDTGITMCLILNLQDNFDYCTFYVKGIDIRP